MKACLKHKEELGIVGDFSDFTRKVPFLGKNQVSRVAYLLRRRIKHPAESEAPGETFTMSEEGWITLERIRRMEIWKDGASHLGAKPEVLQSEEAEVPQGDAGTIHADANLARD